MHKRFLALALSMTMTLGMGVTSFAATNEVTSAGTSQVEVSKTIGSEFTVEIPKKITMDGDTQAFTVRAKGNIAPTVDLSVTVDENITMKRTGDEQYTGTATTTLTGNTWTHETLTSEYTKANGSVSFDEAQAGVYTGTGTFTVTLQ